MKRILLTLSACALVLGFGVSAPLRAETIKLRIASGHPPGVVYAGLMKDFFEPEFKKAVESRTKHKVEFVEGYSGSIVKVTEVLEGQLQFSGRQPSQLRPGRLAGEHPCARGRR